MGGKQEGMRILQVKNGKGLLFTVSLDRCADISELSLKGDNYAYIAPCGYVAPTYYDNKGAGFLKSFTAGFLTTCGLTNVGSPCVDQGQEFPLHGSIANTPCEKYCYYIENDEIHICATIRDTALFNQILSTRLKNPKKIIRKCASIIVLMKEHQQFRFTIIRSKRALKFPLI